MGHLAVAHKGLGEGVGGEDIFGLEELHREVVGARHREAEGQLVVDGGCGQLAVLEVIRAVQHIVGDHVADLALGAVGVDPVGNGLDLRQILAVIDQLVQPDELLGDCQREVIHQKARQGNGGQGRAAHRGGKHEGEHPEHDLCRPEAVDALGQRRCAQQKQEKPPREEQQHLVGAGVLDAGEQQHAQQDLQPGKAGQRGHFALFQAEPQPHAHEHKVHQTHAPELQADLGCKAAAVIVGIALGVAVSEDAADHRPQQDQHGHHAHQAEQHEVAHLQKRLLFLPGAGNARAAYQHQHRVGKVVAHHKI